MAEKLRHVAIIMDGNGRWAQAKGLRRSQGHLAGMDAIREIIRASKEEGIPYVSFYAFSAENFQRPYEEVTFLMGLIRKYFDSELDELLREGARLRFLGDWSLFSFPIRHIFKKAQELSKDNDQIHLQFMLGYGSRQEMVRGINSLLEKGVKKIHEEDFSKALYTQDLPDPDLLIRTGGEMRLSNFMLYQLSYSELYFTPVLWPDFTKEEYKKALNEFAQRERRYGKVLTD